MPDRILINTGPSPRGWHRLESFLRCPTHYYWQHVQGRNEEKPELVRGSIGHAGIAHLYARLRAVTAGEDHRQFYSPPDAMRLVADTFGALGRKLLPDVVSLIERYANHYAFDRFKVLGVENLMETEFHGYCYTARADLVIEGADNLVWIIDHKIVGRIDDRGFKRYALSGQFLGLTHLGSRTFGTRFGGVMVNAASMRGQFERRQIEPAPWALERFPEVVRLAEEGIAKYQGQPPEAWPAAYSEQVCMTMYGPCPYVEACRWGVRSLVTLSLST